MLRNKEILNIILLFVLSLLWGLHFSLVKLVDINVNPITILMPMMSVLTLLFFIYLYIKNEFFKITFWKTIFFLIAGIFAYLIPLSIEFVVAPKIEASHLTLIVATVPIFTLLIIWAFRLMNVTLKLFLGTMFGLIGLLILLINNPNNNQINLSIWTLLAFLVPISYSLDSLFMEKFWPRKLNFIQVAFGECLIVFLILLITALFLNFPISSYTNYYYSSTFWILSIITFCEVALFYYILNRSGAIFIAFSSYLVMPAGFLWGFLIFGEIFTLSKLVCTFTIIFSIWLIGNLNLKIDNTPMD